MTTIETATAVIDLANKHVNNGSALVCLNDAKNWRIVGKYDLAVSRGLKSLAYSVGMFHADYKEAAALK